MILITGGYNGAPMKSAEIFDPVKKTSCSLPKLPEPRNQHTQDGDLACGGGDGASTTITCVKWSPLEGTWTKSHNGGFSRYGHLSWATDSGVHLIGGVSFLSSKKVMLDGSVEDSFVLKYSTRFYSVHFIKISEYFIFDRFACAIPDQEKKELIITGGQFTQTTVSVYSEAGWQRNWASLNQGRYGHACGSYVNGGKKVNHDFAYVCIEMRCTFNF